MFVISGADTIATSVSTKRPRVDEISCNKLPRSSTNENFKSKNVESSESDLELNATINKLNSTHLSSTENIFSEHEIENDEFDKLK